MAISFSAACNVPDVRTRETASHSYAPVEIYESPDGSDSHTYSGADSCKKCHQQIYQNWNRTRHNRRLTDSDYRSPPHGGTCHRCHQTSPQDAVVGCESCHGPRAGHVLQPEPVEPADCRICDIQKKCIQCHMRSVDPDFKPGKGWAKVDHGKQP
jgi:hypothetical protein